MAKRKRLTPPDPARLVPAGGLETKGMLGPGLGAGAPPIAEVAGEAAASAALREVSETLGQARARGRLVLELPLDQIDLGYLQRDRFRPPSGAEDPDMAALVASLRARGQQTPIEVVALGGDRYGLISGWRRCSALRQLLSETGDAEAFGSVLALQRRPAEMSEAYVAMIEENEIRTGLSYYERASIVLRAVAHDVFPDERAALQGLYAAASRPRRSKIGSFLRIVTALDGVLRFPTSLGERLGLEVSKTLETGPEAGARLRTALLKARPESAAAEAACLKAVLAEMARAEKAADCGETGSDSGREAPALPDLPGLRLSESKSGALTLSGPALDADLRTRLLDWLKTQV